MLHSLDIIISAMRSGWNSFVEDMKKEEPPYPLDAEEWAAAKESMAEAENMRSLLEEAKELTKQ